MSDRRGPYRLWIYWHDSSLDSVEVYRTKRQLDERIRAAIRYERETDAGKHEGFGWSWFDDSEWRRMAEEKPKLAEILYVLEQG